MKQLLKNNQMRFVLACCIAVFLLVPFAKGAEAGYKDGFAVSYLPWSENEEMPVVRVGLYETGKKQYLFLPGWWDTKKLYAYAPTERGPHEIRAAETEAISLLGDKPTAQLTPDQTVTILQKEKNRTIQQFIVKQGGALPSIFIQTQTNSTKAIHASKEVREPGKMVMHDKDGKILYQGALREIKTRGNGTFAYPKKPYQIKLENKMDLLGSGAARTWILLADYLDTSLVRNRITLDMARYAGLRYALACQSVDLYINGNYAGVYLLCEKPQIDPSRVDIHDMQDEMDFLNPLPLEEYPSFSESFKDGSALRGYLLAEEPEDITGGYLLEIDKAYRIRKDGKSYVFTPQGMGILVDEPEIVGKKQITYLYELLNAFNRAIREKDGTDPLTGQYYGDIMDEESFAIKFLLEEISLNFDARAGSQYFYKDSSLVDPKLYAGPGWDYDLTYGNYLSIHPRNGFLTSLRTAYPWYSNAYNNVPAFKEKVISLYSERLRPAIRILLGEETPDTDSPLKSLQAYQEEIGGSGEMNGIMWHPSSLKKYNIKNAYSFSQATGGLISFLKYRIEGLDKIFGLKN